MYRNYPYPYFNTTPMNSPYNMYYSRGMYPYYYNNTPTYPTNILNQNVNPYAPVMEELETELPLDFIPETQESDFTELKDYGPEPFVVNIDEATKENENFRTALWTGTHLQLTLMSIPVGGEIGLENHPNLDQFIRIEDGEGIVKMGVQKENLDFQENVSDDFAFIIPAGTWHNLVNTGDRPLKLYSIYAPPQHPYGTVHETKEVAEAAEKMLSH